MPDWHSIAKKEVLRELNSREDGLSEKEAASRLEEYGLNELSEENAISPIKILLTQFKSVFVTILLAAAIFSFFIKHYLDFAVIFAIVLINGGIGFFQQYRAEKTIKEMKKMLVPKVKVFRNGILIEISSNSLVPGDVIFISEGDKIMADCRVLSSSDIEANEAVLTGESFPVSKVPETLTLKTILPDRKNMLYMGTTIVRGSGKAIVVSTGMSTEFGNIAGLVQTVKQERTPLEQKLDSFSMKLAAAILIIVVITVFIGLYRGEEIFNMILTGVALAVSVIPEGLPAVIALTLAFAIRRMHHRNALIRTLPSAETLGRTTVICADKTGTMTEEKMTVTKLYTGKNYFDIQNGTFLFKNKVIEPLRAKSLSMLFKIGILCNNARTEQMEDGIKLLGDPTEKAILVASTKAGLSKKKETESEPRVKEYSFSSKRKMMSIVRESKRRYVSYVKGAPDTILKACTKEYVNGKAVTLTSKRKAELLSIYKNMASSALRVLGFAFKYLPKKFSQESAENNLIFVGFQGMIDPPRKEVPAAVRECLEAGIKVKMVTGDSLVTAEAVSKMIGLNGGSIDAEEMENLSKEDFATVVREKTIFARISPELKLRIIQELKSQKEIVAVTGDGVNDVLALKEAHIGVAMGIRGTDVARESSDIILLDDNFASIVKAVAEGRRVYDNMKKSIKLHLAANANDIFVVLFAIMLAMPLPMLPLAILWLNLITDSLPSLALTVEPPEENIMKRKPRRPDEGILEGIKSFILMAGIISFLVAIGVFIFNYQIDLAKARTMTLSVAVFFELFLVFVCRSDNKNIWQLGIFSNKAVVYAVAIAFILQLVVIYTPLLFVFGFSALSAKELFITIGLGSLGIIFFETKKFIKRKKSKF